MERQKNEMIVMRQIVALNGEEPSSSVQDEYREMPETYFIYRDAFLQDDDVVEPTQDREELNFKNLVDDAELPLYTGCSYTKMSAIVVLYKYKARHSLTDIAFDGLLHLLHGFLPRDNRLPNSLRGRHVQSVVLHSGKLMSVPKKFNKESLQRSCFTFQSYQDLGECLSHRKRQNHYTDRSHDGKMRHPVDALASNGIDNKWPSFASDPRNLRLGLSSDGFNPFDDLSSKYSCWPVILVAYNLLPSLCMSKENLMLTLLIPGPRQPRNDIDIYLEPLVEDLKELWINGVKCGQKPRTLTGSEVLQVVKNFNNDWGKAKKKINTKRKRKTDKYSIWPWKKKSVFFELPYWESSKQGKKKAKKQRLAVAAAATIVAARNRSLRISDRGSNSPSRDEPNEVPIVKECKKTTLTKKHQRRRLRGKAKLLSLTKGKTKGSRVVVEFNLADQPFRDNAARFSSFLGITARELVPITLKSWKDMSDNFINQIWEHITQKFSLDDCHKKYTF
ncbi:transposable element gene [Prunus dulcis]|uniref:Transposable element protein n=1 Tax=Prunus dulcis TaxID=3755 RepID=A0A4Y1R604_PRUDU|nr:transposable element gene [Prunus dulcis]